MPMESTVVLLVHVLNAAMLFILLRGIMRGGAPGARSLPRVGTTAVVLLLDASFLLWLDCSLKSAASLLLVCCVASTLFPDSATARIGAALGRVRFLIYLSSVFTVASLVHLHLPITTFLTSPGEIGIHLGFLFQTNARNMMVLVYLAAGLYALAFTSRMRTMLASLSFVALLLALLYAYVFPLGYPNMNGLLFEQIPISPAQLLFRTLVDLFTLTLVTWLGLIFLERLRGRTLLLSILLVNLSLCIASGLAIVRDAAQFTATTTATTAEAAQPLRFAPGQHNVLILFLDRFMGGFVERILEEEPELRRDLDGFVWYPRTISAGDNSIAGLHPLIGGYDYTPREMNRRNLPLRDVSAESFAILPHNFSRKGYQVNFVNPSGLGFTMAGDCSFLKVPGVNCSHVSAAISRKLGERYGVPMAALARSSYADLLVLLGTMRATPYLVRAVIRERGPWQPFLDHSAGTTFMEWAELKSLPELSYAGAERPNLNIFFNALPHEPYFLGENCQPRPRPLSLSAEEIRQRGFSSLFALQHFVAARCSLKLLADYFRWMEAGGVYDQTEIVVVSDHGIIGPVEDQSSRAVTGGTTDNFFVRFRSLLLLKEPGAHGALRVSEDFRPNASVPHTLCKGIGGCLNPFLGNRPIEAHGRDLPFFLAVVPWQFTLQEPTRFKMLEEFVLRSPDPYDRRSWSRASASGPSAD